MEKLKIFQNHCLFISGGEDCSLRVSRGVQLISGNGIEDFETLTIVNGHISSIKCLAILNIENTELFCKNLIFSGGGRAQLKVWQLNMKLKNGELLRDNLTCKLLESFMLRGTDKERKKMSKTLKNTFDIDRSLGNKFLLLFISFIFLFYLNNLSNYIQCYEFYFLGVSQLAVVVNKLDTVEWSKERFNEIVNKMSNFLKQVGFRDTVTFVPASGLSGENIVSPPKEVLASW